MFRVVSVLACLIVSGESFSNHDQFDSGDFPFLVFIEIQHSSSVKSYLNGCLASWSWVLTDSSSLSKIPSGRFTSPSVTVYADLKSFNLISSTNRRPANGIMTNLLGSDDNIVFPNLVLLKLNSPFSQYDRVRPVVFNVGMLNSKSLAVGWARHRVSNEILDLPLVVHVTTTMHKTGCNRDRTIKDYPHQICAYAVQPLTYQEPWTFLPGALLIDQGFLTAIIRVQTYIDTSYGSVLLMVRLATYVPWIQYVVLDPVPSEVFLETAYSDYGDRFLNPFERTRETKGISVTTDIPKTNNGTGHRSESGQLTQHFYINVLSIQFIVVLNYLN